MEIVVAGSHGLVGTALVDHLAHQGHRVRRLVRRPPTSSREIGWDPTTGRLVPEHLRGADAIVNLGGAGVGDRRWTAAYRREVVRSRTEPTSLLARALAEIENGPKVWLQSSAIGFYGDRGDEILTEQSSHGEGFLADLVAEWESSTAPAEQAGVRVAHLRTGIVMSRTGGSLGRLLPLLRLGLGGPLGSGRHFWSWITLVDQVRAIEHLLTANVDGPVNLTAPNPARQGEIAAALARRLGRPAVVRVPKPVLRAVLGPFAAEALSSQRAVPAVLAASGFEHTHATLDAAARWVTERPARPR